MEVKHLLSPQEWAEQTFGAAQLGHVARTRRAVAMAAAMAREPAGSLPAQQQSDAGTKAVYRFCENGHVSYEALMQPHQQATRQQARQVPQVLLIQDTTELDYQHHPKTRGLGPIGNGTHQGFLRALRARAGCGDRRSDGSGPSGTLSAPACAQRRNRPAEAGARPREASSGNERCRASECHPKVCRGFMSGIAIAICLISSPSVGR